MLYYLFNQLTSIESGFNLFRYITFRASVSALTAFAICLILGPWSIRKLTALKVGQQIRRDDAPDLYKIHGSKGGTPTMGGLLLVAAIVLSTLMWARLSNSMIWVAIISTTFLAGIGFLDDYFKLTKKNPKGLRGWWKFSLQAVLGLALGLYLYAWPNSKAFVTTVEIPFFSGVYLDLDVYYILLVMLIIVATSNAVNLTDGLDGLAAGLVTMAALAYTGMAYLVGRIDFARYLKIIHVEGAGELTIFCAALVGAGVGFLWFNAYPAQLFMGDTGSLALGGALGIVALLVKKELLLAIVGGIFVIEALSVIVQVLSFQLTGKRPFLMSPLHHHLELKGWSETKITVRFWILGALCSLLALSTLKIR